MTRCRGLDYGDDHAWVPWSYLAHRLGLRFNSGQLSRGRAARYDAQCAALDQEVAAGQLRRRAIYVVRDDVRERFPGSVATCGRLDGKAVCVARDAPAPFRQALAPRP